MIEIAGVAISTIGNIGKLLKIYKDASKWEEKELEVDEYWLDAALKKGIIDGPPESLEWLSERRLPTIMLEEKGEPVFAIDDQSRTKYKIVWGGKSDIGGRNILIRKKG